MYYPEEVIEEVRERNDVVDVIGSYVQLKKKGSSYFGLCPFHNEKSPSFSVSPGKQMYYCFGCGKGGNVISFIMEYENFGFVDALKLLADRAGVALPEAEYSKEDKKRTDEKNLLLEIQKKAALYFYYQLKSENGARGYEYLKNRGLSDQTIKSFGLGFANPYPNDLYRYLKQQGYSDLTLKESGLVKIEERGAYDKFWNRVMFPIMDINNRVIGFGGRVMGDGSPKYLNSPETKIFDKSRNLYGMNAARKSRKPYILICEGYMDVISMHQAGFTNAVASLGTAFTLQHGLLIKRYTKEVILAYDSDTAGINAALRAIPILKDAGLSIRVLNLKPYKDPDEFIKAEGAEAFQQRLDEVENSFLFEIRVIKEQYSMEDPEQKTQFFNEAAKKLLEFSDEMERNNYMEAIARTYHISYDLLKRRVIYYGSRTELKEKPMKLRSGIQSRREKDAGVKQAQKLLITWICEEPEIFSKVHNILNPSDFTEGIYQKIAKLLFAQGERGEINPAEILNHFMQGEEEDTQAAAIFHAKLPIYPTREERNRAFRETVLRIKRNHLEEISKHVQQMDELQEIVRKKKELEELNISLD